MGIKILFQIYDDQNLVSGPVINALRLLPVLKARGYEITALIGHYGKGHPNADSMKQYGLHVILYRIPLYSEDHVCKIFDAIEMVQPDIFVSNISCQAGFAGRWVRKSNIPVIHTIRGNHALNLGMAKFFFNNSEWKLDHLVSVNEFLANTITKTLGPIPCTVIPSGVIVPESHKKQLSDKKIGFVYSGRITDKGKNVSKIISIFILLAKRNPNIFFSIIGNCENNLLVKVLKESVILNKLEKRIQFKNKLTGSAYINELQKHHIAILYSDYEGTPGSMMDAMACGLVPIARRIDGLNELIINRHNGLLIDGSMDEFIQHTENLIYDQAKRNKMSINARKTIKKNFSIEYAADQWVMLFEQLIKERRETKNLFVRPKHFDLPPASDLLIEHYPKPGLFGILRDKIQLRTRLKKLLS